MDPNATYSEIVSIINFNNKGHAIDIDRLDELCEELNSWLYNKGFKPRNYNYNVMKKANKIIMSSE